MSTLPHVGSTVQLIGAEGDPLTTVVLLENKESVVVELPAERKGETEEVTGEAFQLCWPGDKGVHMIPVLAQAEPSSDGRRAWLLTADGEYRFIQRRGFVRVPVRNAMTIANLDEDSGGESQNATLVDVSENSLQCAIQDVSWIEVGPKTPVRVRFTVADTDFVTNGWVLRSTRIGSESLPKGARVVVIFDERTDFTDRLRKGVFEEQRRRIFEERNRNF